MKHITPTIADTVNQIIARQDKTPKKKEKKMQHAQQRTMTLNEQEYVDQVPLTVRMYILGLEKQNAALVVMLKEAVGCINDELNAAGDDAYGKNAHPMYKDKQKTVVKAEKLLAAVKRC